MKEEKNLREVRIRIMRLEINMIKELEPGTLRRGAKVPKATQTLGHVENTGTEIS